MKQVWQKLFLITFPLATLGSLAPITNVKAQITRDNTLGAENSVVNPNLTIRGIPSDRIDGGARRGGNLFHSFQEFNVGAGRGAYFSNPAGVENILTRVTGSNPSNILGRLGVLGNANLFFINPNGIVFGQNASLDVRGSFFASTASSLIFNNGFEFSATNPQAPPLLTVNIPIGLRFRDNPGDITVNGIGQNQGLDGASNSFQNPTLAVDAGNTLALVGGNVSLNGGVLQAPGGRVELGGLTAGGKVDINDDSLSFPNGVARGDVALTNQAGINVITNALGGGSININARNIGISGRSLLSAGTAGDLGELNSVAGDITLNATGETRIDQSRIENNVNSGTIANNTNINIVTGSFFLINGAQLSTSNLGSSQDRYAGDVNITADGQATINGGASIFSNGFFGRVFLTSSNNSVNISNSSITTTSDNDNSTQNSLIQITAPTSNILIDNSTLSTTNSGTGFAGDITLNALNQVSLNQSSISSDGSLGHIFIGRPGSNATFPVPNSINIDNSTLSTNNSGTEFAGDIVLNARDQVSLTTNSTISSNGRFGRILIGKNDVYSDVTSSPQEVSLNASTLSTTNSSVTDAPDTQINAGEISINALNRISIEGSRIETSTRRFGNAGDVTLQAYNGDISLTGSRISSNVESGTTLESIGIGYAGNINITARNLSLTQDTELQSLLRGASGDLPFAGFGFAGDIIINTSGDVTFNNSRAFSSVERGAIGKGGNINVTAKTFSLTNGALLSTTTSGQAGQTGMADAGNIQVNISDTVSLSGGGQLRSDTYGQGNAGKITIDGHDGVVPIVTLDGIGFVNNVQRFSGVGSSVGNDSQLGVGNGKGGDISIRARSLSLTNGAQINASTFGVGDAGNVTINTNDTVSLNGIGSNGLSSGVFSGVDGAANGRGGDISIRARSLSLKNGGIINTSTFGVGDAGNVTINANDTVFLDGVGSNGFASGVFSAVISGAMGKGGNINIHARNLSLTGGAEVITETLGNGDAGKIDVNTTDSISLSGVAPFPTLENGYPGGFSSGLINTTEAEANGRGGEIKVTTSKLQISDGAVLNARSRSNFRGGDITINANTLEVTGGGQILTTSFSNGDAGSITANVNDRINISGSDPSYRERLNSVANAFSRGFNTIPNGEVVARSTIDAVSSESGIFANTASGSTARGGNLTINTQQLDVRNGGTITVSSPQGQAGNLTITAKTIRLDQGNITAETARTSPNEREPNINLQGLDLLSLRNRSRISAEAFGEAQGGNITINAANGFVVAFPGGGSDIIAKASGGRGGNIQIEALSIYGLVEGQSINGNGINYIDASSQFGQEGTVNLNTSYLNPTQNLVELPENVVDPTTQIAQNPCQHGAGSTFAITGRGGIPSNPNQTIASDNVRVGLVTPVSSRGTATTTANAPLTQPTVKKAVPVQGWVFNDKGQVVLTAYDPTKTGSQRPWRTPASCAQR